MASNGLVARSDDHGNTIGTATRLGGSTAGGLSSFAGTGFVERPGDVDAFSFVSGAGSISVTIRPAQRSPNLDIAAELVDSSGKTLSAVNPVDAFGATLTHDASSGGTYYVTVKGTGKGDLTTGYSNYGSLGEYSIAATAPAATSQSPVAVLSAAPTSGMTPLTVTFGSSGSYDPDGSVQRIEWNFGDGSAPQVASSAQHVYAAAGIYTATLKVTDNAGLTDTTSVTIRADAPVTLLAMHVEDIALSLRIHKNGQAEAVASVTVRDASGNAVPGATVAGTWSGVVNSSTSAMTGSSGVATMKTQRTRALGSYTFTVTSISLAGYQYVPASNKESTATVSR
jgi:PKD repeat protein